MKATKLLSAVVLGLCILPCVAGAADIICNVWTDRVCYQPIDPIVIAVRIQKEDGGVRETLWVSPWVYIGDEIYWYPDWGPIQQFTEIALPNRPAAWMKAIVSTCPENIPGYRLLSGSSGMLVYSVDMELLIGIYTSWAVE